MIGNCYKSVFERMERFFGAGMNRMMSLGLGVRRRHDVLGFLGVIKIDIVNARTIGWLGFNFKVERVSNLTQFGVLYYTVLLCFGTP